MILQKHCVGASHKNDVQENYEESSQRVADTSIFLGREQQTQAGRQEDTRNTTEDSPE